MQYEDQILKNINNTIIYKNNDLQSVIMNIEKQCIKHGNVLFKQKSYKTRKYFVCSVCLKEQSRRASAKYRQNHREYYRNYSNQYSKIRKTLSIYLTIVLIMNERINEK